MWTKGSNIQHIFFVVVVLKEFFLTLDILQKTFRELSTKSLKKLVVTKIKFKTWAESKCFKVHPREWVGPAATTYLLKVFNWQHDNVHNGHSKYIFMLENIQLAFTRYIRYLIIFSSESAGKP